VRDTQNIWSIGDCAIIPLNEEQKSKEDFAPPTAQFAVREAKDWLKILKPNLKINHLNLFNIIPKGLWHPWALDAVLPKYLVSNLQVGSLG
jgi:NADH dehydrogenase